MLVVRDSTQYLTQDDNRAIASFLNKIGTPRQQAAKSPDAPTQTEELLSSARADMPLGARLYLDNCGGCHLVNGKGAPEIFPELDGNSLVTAKSSKGLISVILHGAELPSTEKRPMKVRMQGYEDRLSDEEIATLATFLRKAWTNEASAVTTQDVEAIRKLGNGH